ncbi:hypothetical protein GALMADRAFT_254935 [Galerina marginata CBS 339.88]|uniref:Uncharacterized protein n=1 Tax=Galerina marginata (strain CBS 339.88) TaxID=685588 RepID=A0A067SJB6_GALM3|nr:hypothetical protein GALMADRAFT_254935 [Galerina marginata CBS 339.88]
MLINACSLSRQTTSCLSFSLSASPSPSHHTPRLIGLTLFQLSVATSFVLLSLGILEAGFKRNWKSSLLSASKVVSLATAARKSLNLAHRKPPAVGTG